MYSYEPKEPRVIQGSEDVPALKAELAAEDWCGPTMSILQDDLWLYGWDVLRGLIRKHRVPGKYQPHLSEADWALLQDSSADREEVCLETLGSAVPKFIDSLRHGTYDPSKSSMATYFTGRCGIEFRPVAETWRNKRTQIAHEISNVAWSKIQLPGAPSPTSEAVQRILLNNALNTLKPNERAVMVATLLDETQADIADRMELSVRAVEGIARRARNKLAGNSAGKALRMHLLDSAQEHGFVPSLELELIDDYC